jgi:hypothetical protein
VTPLVAERYEIVRPRGAGAFAETYPARDARAGPLVALEALP